MTDVRLRSFAATQRSTWLFLEVMTDSGLTGTGECSDSTWAARVPRAVAALAERVRGADLKHRAAWCAVLRRECEALADPRERFMQRTILGGLDMALIDLVAQAEGVPLWEWLGGTPRTAVPLYANINRSGGTRTPPEFAAKAVEAVADGFGKVKVACFDGPALPGTSIVETGVAIVAAMREAVGPEIDLMVDVHHKLSRTELAGAIPPLDGLGIAWLEDAVDVTDAAAMEWLGERTDIPIAGGEALHSAGQIEAALSTGVLKVLLLDPKYTGGATELVRLAAGISGVALTYHNPCGPISTAVCAHLGAVHPDFTLLEVCTGEDVDRPTVTIPAEKIVAGSLPVPAGPGLGVRLAPQVRAGAT